MTTATVLETSKPRAGRRFTPTHELALLDSAMAACNSLPNVRPGLLVISEMTGPIGIPDLTALVGDLGFLADRLALDVPPLLNEVDAAAAAVAHPRIGRSVSAMANALQWPEHTVARRLPGLLRMGALRELRPGRYVRPAALAPLGRLYAVEAKVREWRQALRQARSYSVWVDSYVLVMGPLGADVLSRLRSEVEADRGGLVVDGRWIRRPTIHRLSRARRLWAAEHVAAALQSGGYQPSPSP